MDAVIPKDHKYNLLSNLINSDIFGTIEMCSRYRLFEPLGSIMTPGQEANGDNLGIFVFYLLDKYGDFNEYTQHTISLSNKNVSLNICFLELSEEFRRDSKTSPNQSW